MDRSEGKHWNLVPGNLYCKPQKITPQPSAKLEGKILALLSRGDFQAA